MNALRECPFCGAAPRIDTNERSTFISCVNRDCGVQPEGQEFADFEFADHKAEAIAAWNRRAATTGRETREATNAGGVDHAIEELCMLGENAFRDDPKRSFGAIAEAVFLLRAKSGRALASNGDGE